VDPGAGLDDLEVPIWCSEAGGGGDGKEEETMEEEQDGTASIEAPSP
jgi:hypothetical protein